MYSSCQTISQDNYTSVVSVWAVYTAMTDVAILQRIHRLEASSLRSHRDLEVDSSWSRRELTANPQRNMTEGEKKNHTMLASNSKRVHSDHLLRIHSELNYVMRYRPSHLKKWWSHQRKQFEACLELFNGSASWGFRTRMEWLEVGPRLEASTVQFQVHSSEAVDLWPRAPSGLAYQVAPRVSSCSTCCITLLCTPNFTPRNKHVALFRNYQRRCQCTCSTERAHAHTHCDTR